MNMLLAMFTKVEDDLGVWMECFLYLSVGFMQVKPQPTILPAVPRLVAIGDLHGDLGKTRRAFRLGGLTDANDRWIGGTTTAVQVALPSPHPH